MRQAFQCRMCKGPPVSAEPLGACKNCSRFARHNSIRIPEDGERSSEFPMEVIKLNEPVAADTLMAGEDDESEKPLQTGSAGIDWVFDDRFPRVGTILFAAKEGSGKSTWLWQLLQRLGKKRIIKKSLFESSEQSLGGLRRQFKRCGSLPAGMLVHCDDNKASLFRAIEKEEPEILVLDSLHHVTGIEDEDGYTMAAGAPRAVAKIAKDINKLAEEIGLLAFLVGHMGNDGVMQGGAGLRHAVDATLGLWRSDDLKDTRRILQFETKTRFGRPDRRALFMMSETGLKDCGPILDEDDKPKEPPIKPGLRLVPGEDE